MPIVHEYTADAQVTGPFQTRQAKELDTGNVGGAVASFGNQAMSFGEQMHKREAQAEITDLNAKLSKAHADYTNNLQDTFKNADPADRTITDKFLTTYDKQMGDLGDNIQTPEAQAYFERANSQMRNHFQTTAMAKQAQLAGTHAVLGQTTATNNYATSLMNDPSSFEQTRTLNAMGIQALHENGTIDADSAQKLMAASDEQLAKGAIRGWINPTGLNAPEKAIADINSGKWDAYLKGDEKYQMLKEAEQAVRGKKADAERAEAKARQDQYQVQIKTQNDFIEKLQSNELTAADVLHSPLDPVGSGSKEHFLKLIEAQATKKPKTDNATYIDTFDRIHAADGDPRKLTDPNQLNELVVQGKLTVPDLNRLRKEMIGNSTPEGKNENMLKKAYLDTVKSELVKGDPMKGIPDPEGQANYTRYLGDFLTNYNKARAAGKSPNDLLVKGSPDYMGNNISAYSRTQDQILKSLTQKPTEEYGPASPNPSLYKSGSNVPPDTKNNPAAPPPPKVGDIVKGYKYKGGPLHDSKSWEKHS